MDDYSRQRQNMVTEQLERRGLQDARLLQAFLTVPRHMFVPEEYRQYAYDDQPLPIDYHQTISQPYIVALMTSLLELSEEDRVLEIGTGSGYQAAILSRLSKEVHTIEIIPGLYESARRLLLELGYTNIQCHPGDGSLGWTPAAPYDAIVVAAAAPTVPQELFDQLGEGGKLVTPVGGGDYQELHIWSREEGRLNRRKSIGVAFVPLRGEHGWK
jgi:protein-L-isoaspartate(D-aspartate) O-methyltransferase